MFNFIIRAVTVSCNKNLATSDFDVFERAINMRKLYKYLNQKLGTIRFFVETYLIY